MQLGRHKRILETRLRELSNTLGRRQNIVIERAPDAVDDLELAGERNLAMRSLEKRFAQLRFVEAALDRIAAGTYGCCLQCDEEIGMKRLTALPHAVFCISCQESAEHSESQGPEVSTELAGVPIGA
jgi:DnaK suppressor protein